MPRRLSAHARRFLTEDVHSVMQLELMLLLARDPDMPWTADAIARELRAPPPWVVAQLADLMAAGAARSDDDRRDYRFDRAAAMTPVIDEIAAQYPRRRTTIIRLIFASGASDAQPSSG